MLFEVYADLIENPDSGFTIENVPSIERKEVERVLEERHAKEEDLRGILAPLFLLEKFL